MCAAPNALHLLRMFELKCTIPVEKDLYVRVRDYDLIGTDDTVGETKIDLENRLMTKFRATCGLPRSYYVNGKCAHQCVYHGPCP